jgi:hypothetical protein
MRGLGKQFTSVFDFWHPGTFHIVGVRQGATNMGTLCMATDEDAIVVSNKQAKRLLFRLEKMHWANASLRECKDWLAADFNYYLNDPQAQFIELVFDKQKAWCRYEKYLERFGHYVRRREERDGKAVRTDVTGSRR